MYFDPVPENPLPVIRTWLDEAASSGLRNHDALALATVSSAGLPSVRMVLMRGLSVAEGYAVFYTNYRSRKAVELEQTGVAAGVMYWPTSGRQIRVEGRIQRSPAAESDEYFARRPAGSRLNAWVSEQSRPLTDRHELDARATRMQSQFEEQQTLHDIPRPGHWGGYRLWFTAVELWLEGGDRFHDRVLYERTLSPIAGGDFQSGPWQRTRLQP